MGMIEVEHHELVLRYQSLRVRNPSRQARLVASLAREGQKSPVLVIPVEDRYILIDGYARVAALRELGEDTVVAVELEIGETEALLLQHRLENARERSALEEGWLLRHLLGPGGLSREEAAEALGRSLSWVSRRLGLVEKLPEEVQEQVRRGKLPAYAAAKYLLPLARANRGACVTLVGNLPAGRLSTRQIEKIYVAWRKADPLGRERIEADPTLLLKVESDLPEEDGHLLADLRMLGGICRRAHHRLDRVIGWEGQAPRPFEQAALALEVAYRNLHSGLAEKGLRAGSR